MPMSNKSQNKPVSVDDWYKLVSSKSKCSLENVKKILDKYGIEPQATTPIRKAIHFQELRFYGTKVGTKNDGNFSFEWDNLDAGLYGVLSEDNLVGKSSILRLLYGVLRGDFSGVSEPIMGWINSLYAKFSVGEVNIELQLLRQETDLQATLTRSNNSTEIEEYSGHASGLAAVVDQLLMKELEFERMFATKEAKSLVPHGWPALASALFISGSEGAIIGDLILSGLPQRLLQLFIGLPWISTQSRASAVHKIEEASSKSKGDVKASAYLVLNALSRLQKELDELPNTKTIEELRSNDRKRQLALEREIDQNILSSKQINIDVEEIAAEHSTLQTEHLQMRRLKQSLEDDRSAGFVFRKLHPVCCPSCESTIFKLDASSEPNSNQCPLCKGKEPAAEPKGDSQLIELQEEIDSIESQISFLSKEQKNKLDKLNSVKERIERDKNELKEIAERRSSDTSIEETATRRSSLEATIAEFKKLAEIEDSYETSSSDELTVLKAAAFETKKMYQEKESDLFVDASVLLKEIASTLGVKHLVNVTWISTKLSIKVANKEITYTKLSPGEKLRFRIAASITIARLAAKTGQGRHPGILFFDSPKNEVMSEDDFQEIMLALTELTKDDTDLQIFVATRVPKGYTGKGLFKNTKLAVGKNFMF